MDGKGRHFIAVIKTHKHTRGPNAHLRLAPYNLLSTLALIFFHFDRFIGGLMTRGRTFAIFLQEKLTFWKDAYLFMNLIFFII